MIALVSPSFTQLLGLNKTLCELPVPIAKQLGAAQFPWLLWKKPKPNRPIPGDVGQLTRGGTNWGNNLEN